MNDVQYRNNLRWVDPIAEHQTILFTPCGMEKSAWISEASVTSMTRHAAGVIGHALLEITNGARTMRSTHHKRAGCRTP